MLPYSIELNGEFCGQLTVGNVTDGALRSAWIGYWVSSSVTGGGVATGALGRLVSITASARSCCIAWKPRYGRRTRRAGRCWQRSAFAKKGCCAAISKSTGAGATTSLVGLTVEEIYGSVTSALVRSGEANWA